MDDPALRSMSSRLARSVLASHRRWLGSSLQDEMASLSLDEAVSTLDTSIPVWTSTRQCYGDAGRTDASQREFASTKLDKVVFLENTMYGKCGGLQEASLVFEKMAERNVYTWTIIIAAGQCTERLSGTGTASVLPDEPAPSNHTLSIAVSSCSALMDLSRGRKIQASLEGLGLEADDHLKNTLMVLYTKCGSLDDVKKMIWSMGDNAKLASWTSLVVGCVEIGSYSEAFHFFRLMELQGIHADAVTYAGLLDACSNLASLSRVRELHARVAELGLLQTDLVLQTSILTMYFKCGRLAEARRIFDNIGAKNIVTWTAIIVAYAGNGDSSTALKLFWRMEQAGQKASQTALVSVLYACSHAGLVDDAYYYFTTMKGLEPLLEYYGCVVVVLLALSPRLRSGPSTRCFGVDERR